MTNHLPLIVIAGPTGVGKTDLSIQLAQDFQGEVINGDSLQVYRGLDIGTGKITKEEMQGVPHQLLDILEVDQDYDASRFQEGASQAVQAIHGRGHLPFLVGGTGLYLSGLLYDLEFGQKGSTDPQVRQALQERADQLGDLALWQELQARDPQAAAKIPYQNVRRTIRALEVMETTGQLFSDQAHAQEKPSRFDELLLVLDRPRDQLYDRINQRVDGMDQAGLEAEAYQLYLADPQQTYQSTKGIGYKEWWPYFEGQIDRQTVLDQIKQNSRRYAKRQLTWFRNRMKDPHWLDVSDPDQAYQEASQLIRDHLTKEKR
ncbi:tRNA (adenosine(37)-N6)-dimethylallyltransferase MiaA [Hutsoniella sourekii]|uniref:tRNA (adenosine(37)-N6)-dimethylallyltransferase MiaA n=1 Tax=Hutsoniella sourekii TaxID=87650 RepID=UPI0004891805|nr:tRNA (adenosine(37)-N6)-dimethylallyltransferase MiaA [Hutsoniella sourekii]